MDEVGRDFKAGELFVPEVLIAARAMHAGMNVLRPLLAEGESLSAGKYVIGTVKGDLHDIGKNLVRMMLEGAGFETIDLGTDVDPQAFVKAVREHKPKMVGMSALLINDPDEDHGRRARGAGEDSARSWSAAPPDHAHAADRRGCLRGRRGQCRRRRAA
jgi:cobalamin-dependent methionine synthase I